MPAEDPLQRLRRQRGNRGAAAGCRHRHLRRRLRLCGSRRALHDAPPRLLRRRRRRRLRRRRLRRRRLQLLQQTFERRKMLAARLDGQRVDVEGLRDALDRPLQLRVRLLDLLAQRRHARVLRCHPRARERIVAPQPCARPQKQVVLVVVVPVAAAAAAAATAALRTQRKHLKLVRARRGSAAPTQPASRARPRSRTRALPAAGRGGGGGVRHRGEAGAHGEGVLRTHHVAQTHLGEVPRGVVAQVRRREAPVVCGGGGAAAAAAPLLLRAGGPQAQRGVQRLLRRGGHGAAARLRVGDCGGEAAEGRRGGRQAGQVSEARRDPMRQSLALPARDDQPAPRAEVRRRQTRRRGLRAAVRDDTPPLVLRAGVAEAGASGNGRGGGGKRRGGKRRRGGRGGRPAALAQDHAPPVGLLPSLLHPGFDAAAARRPRHGVRAKGTACPRLVHPYDIPRALHVCKRLLVAVVSRGEGGKERKCGGLHNVRGMEKAQSRRTVFNGRGL
eukprot:Rhum_TRINITY_DN9326_c0_g1::Rhum_TRINITY_DN9326_c0_g1_i1::g.32974::m.32974